MEGRRLAAVLILTICLLALEAGASRRQGLRSVCILPAEPGPCKGYMRRYYFDTAFYDCKPFIFGGCGNNGNNFHTYNECYSRCGPE